MRIHSLEITGFGPFKETQLIDFDALTVDHIFMLEGPTGAGKSSIIDAIVWVLYGNTAQQAARKASDEKTGSAEFGDRVHSDYLAPEEETRVKMEFTVNQARYRVQRTQAFAPKKKGSKELITKSTSRLEFIRPTGEPITKDIHIEIYRILQMEVAQFSQLVVMPQAAFDTFLRAKSESRSIVLEKIFRTYFYTKLEDYLKDSGRQIEAQIEELRINIDHHVRNLGNLAESVVDSELNTEDEIRYFRSSSEIASKQSKIEHLEAIVASLTPDSKFDLNEKKRLEDLINPLSNRVTKLLDSKALIEEKTQLSEKLNELENRNQEIALIEANLKVIQKAEPLKLLLNSVLEAQKTLEDIEEIDVELEDWTSLEIKDRLKVIKPQIKELAREIAQNDGLEEKIADLEEDLDAAQERDLAAKETPKLEKSLENLNKKITFQKKKNKEYESKQAESWVHDAAKSLKKGQPCPVCGAKDHPNPVKGKGTFDQDVYDEMLQTLDDLLEEQRVTRENIAYYKPMLKSKKRSTSSIKTELANFEKKLESADQVQLEHDELEEEQQLLEDNLELVAAREKANQAITKVMQTFNQALKKAEIKAEELDAILNLDEEKLKSVVDEYKNELTSVTVLLKRPEFQKLPKIEELDSSIENLSKQIENYQPTLDKVIQRLNLSEDRQNRLDEAKDCIIETLDGIEEILSNKGAVLKLNKLANGTNSEALRLTNFVLQERLEIILERSSLHLLKISNGKFEFKLNEEKGASRKNAGLGITVIDHHAGRERPAETLSGGETFYASLSLCLGLAEVVKMDKGGIELSTLFIDEGFGSLSNDKLTEVLDVLDKLRENGRIIGIITHLEDMKNQIPLRLEVIRSEDGPSSVRMAVGGRD